jgi:hypothetical protein
VERCHLIRSANERHPLLRNSHETHQYRSDEESANQTVTPS